MFLNTPTGGQNYGLETPWVKTERPAASTLE